MVSGKPLEVEVRKLVCEYEDRGDLRCEVPPQSLRALSPCRSQRSNCSLASIMAWS